MHAIYINLYNKGTSIIWGVWKSPKGAHIWEVSLYVYLYPYKKNVTLIKQLRSSMIFFCYRSFQWLSYTQMNVYGLIPAEKSQKSMGPGILLSSSINFRCFCRGSGAFSASFRPIPVKSTYVRSLESSTWTEDKTILYLENWTRVWGGCGYSRGRVDVWMGSMGLCVCVSGVDGCRRVGTGQEGYNAYPPTHPHMQQSRTVKDFYEFQ